MNIIKLKGVVGLLKRRMLTVTYTYYQSNRSVPSIRILGGWLEELGFRIGEKVEIIHSQDKPNELVIKKITNSRRKA